MNLKDRAENLLSTWCITMQQDQIKGIKDKDLHGGLLCPSCLFIHGRCFESMIAFLYMYRKTSDVEWLNSAMDVYYWADRNLSLKDGSFYNDRGCDWLGTTVFNTIAMADSLLYFSDIIPVDFKNDVKQRIARSSDFLYHYEGLKENNVNYPITNSLALYLSYLVLGNEKLRDKAVDFSSVFYDLISDNGFLLGEGVPHDKISDRGCRCIDVGYNIEESLPSLLRYAELSGCNDLLEKAESVMEKHMVFFLDDGAWDNSFGTRNYKWTYWGSRTSDGCLFALLHMAKKNSYYYEAADKALTLLETCTINGLLAGGPHYENAGEPCCIHHTFEHARMLATCLLVGAFDVDDSMPRTLVGRDSIEGMKHYAEIDSYIFNNSKYTTTEVFYDWGYSNLASGHISGGSPGLLVWKGHGPILISGMGKYVRTESFNMQVPSDQDMHQCIDFRVEESVGDVLYSSIYDKNAKSEYEDGILIASGKLVSEDGEILDGSDYEFKYEYKDQEFKISVDCRVGKLIVPVVSPSTDELNIESNEICIKRNNDFVKVVSSAVMSFPYGTNRIFNLIPGVQALKVEIVPKTEMSFMFQ